MLTKIKLENHTPTISNLYTFHDSFQEIATIPFIPGHECTGTVFKSGPEATLKEGQRVAIENHFYCGSCFQVSATDIFQVAN